MLYMTNDGDDDVFSGRRRAKLVEILPLGQASLKRAHNSEDNDRPNKRQMAIDLKRYLTTKVHKPPKVVRHLALNSAQELLKTHVLGPDAVGGCNRGEANWGQLGGFILHGSPQTCRREEDRYRALCDQHMPEPKRACKGTIPMQELKTTLMRDAEAWDRFQGHIPKKSNFCPDRCAKNALRQEQAGWALLVEKNVDKLTKTADPKRMQRLSRAQVSTLITLVKKSPYYSNKSRRRISTMLLQSCGKTRKKLTSAILRCRSADLAQVDIEYVKNVRSQTRTVYRQNGSIFVPPTQPASTWHVPGLRFGS
jgi:hypothetical protein